MRRRLILAILLLLVVGAFVLVRYALDPDVTRHAAEARLSAFLGQPVAIGAMHVSMWPLPALVGTEITVGAQRDTPELALERVRILPRLRSLFRGPYVVREVTLEGLTVRIVREPPGRWRFPAIVPAPGGDEAGGVIIERVRLRGGRVRVFEVTPRSGLRETSSIDDVEGEAVADAAGLRISPIRGRVGGAGISGEAVVNAEEARIDFAMAAVRNNDLDEVLGLAATEPAAFLSLPKPAEASLSIRLDRPKFRLSGTGSIRAPEVGFYSLRLQGLEAPIRTDGTRLSFEPATFSMYGGTHRGRMQVDLSRTPARWVLDSKVTGVDAGDFLAALTGRDQRVDGTVSATAALHAGVGEPMPESLEGRMQVNVANGVIRGFPLLEAINRALRLAEGEGRDTRFERLSATFVLAGRGASSAARAGGPGHATTDDLVLDARDVRVEAAGRIGFDQSLDLAGQAVLSPERSAGAIRSVHELSGLRNDRGELELPIRITGSLDDPSFAIDVKAAVGRSLKEELRRRIKGLIRR